MTPRKHTTRLKWTDYHQSIRRIAVKHNPNHPNYRIHSHDFFELVVITGGTCVHRSEIGDQCVQRGQAFLIRPGATHGYREVRGLSLYNCCFDAALVARELSWMADDPYLVRLLWGVVASPGQVGITSIQLPPHAMTQCLKLLSQFKAFTSKEYLSHHGDHLGLLVQILSLLARNLPPTSRKRLPCTHTAVAEALKQIEASPTEEWTLKKLASRVSVESTYFVRVFRSALGLPPMAYITRRRLELAAKLLLKPEQTVCDVGTLSGWADPNYFSRCFRQHFGMTPSHYRSRFGKF